MDFVIFWLTFLGAAGLAYFLLFSGACGFAVLAWIGFLSVQTRNRRYSLLMLKAGTTATAVGGLLYIVAALKLPGFDLWFFLWPLGPAFFAWGAICSAALHFRDRHRLGQEPL